MTSKTTFSQQDGVTLREYFERIIAHNEETQDKALVIARDELARRLETLNNETSRIKEILASTMPRELAEQRFETLEKEHSEFRIFKAIVDSKASQKGLTIAYIFSAINVLFAVVNLLLTLTKR